MIITSKILAKGRFENGNMGNDVLLGDRGYGLVIFVNVINNPKIKRKIKEYSRTSSSYLEKKIPNSVCRNKDSSTFSPDDYFCKCSIT
nr:unnamed protein product [Callosobruchus analis]